MKNALIWFTPQIYMSFSKTFLSLSFSDQFACLSYLYKSIKGFYDNLREEKNEQETLLDKQEQK